MKQTWVHAASVLFMALLLAGCAEQWQKPGGTEAEFEIMKSNCMDAATHKYPPLLRQEMVSPERVDPVTTNCTRAGPNMTCTTSGGSYHPPMIVTVDDNQQLRDQHVRACYFAHGWNPVKD